MGLSLKKNNKVNIQIDAHDLSPAQIRLMKSLAAMLAHVSSTDDESEFFDGSAECMRMCAAIIKQSNFASDLRGNDNIPYADQAIEYSMDALQECMMDSKVVVYDN